MRIILTFLLLNCFTGIFAQEFEYTTYEIKDVVSISIPSILELQSGNYKELATKFQKAVGNKFLEGRVVFQAKGRNDIFNNENPTNERTPSYEKIIIETKIGNAGDYKKLNIKNKLSPSELKEIEKQFKAKIDEDVKKSSLVKLLTFYGATCLVINNKPVIKISYSRQVNENEPCIVDVYHYLNYDRVHFVTIVYRVNQQNKFKPIFDKIINSFNVRTIE